MTYIIGWKQKNAAFMCADTVLTGFGGAPPKTLSSFGERQIVSKELHIGEGGIKLINLTVAAAAISGHFKPARALLAEFSQRIKAGDRPMNAIERAVLGHTPLSPDSQFGLIIALRNLDETMLLGFNVENDQCLTVVPDRNIIHFGSMPSKYKFIAPKLLEMLIPAFDNQPDRIMAAMLAVLQSFGIHDNLLDYGVGGAFCGLYLADEGARWQGDILNILYSPQVDDLDMVASIVRDNVLVVRSSINNSCGYFADSIMGGIGEKWREQYWDKAHDHIRSGKFDFINLLAKKDRTITVAELRRQNKSDYIHVTPVPAIAPDDELLRLEVAFSPTVMNYMTMPVPDQKDGSLPYKFSWVPFNRPPS